MATLILGPNESLEDLAYYLTAKDDTIYINDINVIIQKHSNHGQEILKGPFKELEFKIKLK